MKPAIEWAKQIERQAEACECADCMLDLVEAIRHEARYAAADIARDAGDTWIADSILEKLARGD